MLGTASSAAAQGIPETRPPWLSWDVDPLTVQYYYGCASEVPSACIYSALGKPATASTWVMFFQPSTFDDSGRWWQTYDIWGAGTSDGECRFTGDYVQFQEGSCQVRRRDELVLTGALDWVGPPYTRTRIRLDPITTPEPATLVLLAPALLGLGVVVRRRDLGRRRRAPR